MLFTAALEWRHSFAAVRHENEMVNTAKLNWLFFTVLLAGIAARLLVATLGHDFDFDSWKIMANLADRGKKCLCQHGQV